MSLTLFPVTGLEIYSCSAPQIYPYNTSKTNTNTNAMTQSTSMSTRHDKDEQHARAADTVCETNAFSYTTKQQLG